MESIHYLLMKAHTRLNQQILTRASAIGLTPGQPKILECLQEHDGCDQKTISAWCEIKPSTTGDILAGMERRGLIERKQKDGNRRSLYVFLTDKGRDALGAMNAQFLASERCALEGVSTAETTQLETLLTQIIHNLEQE